MRAVLTYHSIDESRSPVSVSPAQFAEHARFLASDAVEVVPLGALTNAKESHRPQVAITFDDGFRNFENQALPVLAEFGLPATLFVVTGAVGGTNAWGGVDHPGIPTLPLLDWDGLGRVSQPGITLGAHTHTHPRLSRVSQDQLEEELLRPAQVLQERLGTRPNTVAYPYGDHDAATTRTAARTYDLGYTTELAAVGSGADPLALPRLDMFYLRETGRLQSLGRTGFKAYLGFRRALRRVRAVTAR